MKNRPNQAVILAGGRGSRLRSLTDDRPKPMLLVRGRPFLEYQIEQVRDQGFNRILILLGYMADVVQTYFDDGGKWGVKIEYSVSAIADETSRRLQIAERLLDDHFLLLYCDNYWPMRIERMWSRFVSSGVPAMVTVYTNRDSYTRDSVRVDPDGYISTYDSTCATPGLRGVEISYALIRKSIMNLLPDANVSIGDGLYTHLARTRELAAYTTEHRYYSIGALHRLPATESFLERRPTVLVEISGSPDYNPAAASYIAEECPWSPNAEERDACRLLKKAGYRIIVFVHYSSERALGTLERRIRKAIDPDGDIDAVYSCGPDCNVKCDCVGAMLIHAQREFNLDLTRVMFIGHEGGRSLPFTSEAGCRVIPRSPELSLTQALRDLAVNRDDIDAIPLLTGGALGKASH
jgi:D-glycero-D-manno-heptose 1,7-bisphosphate phosphatase